MNISGIGTYQPSSHVKTGIKKTEKQLFDLSDAQKKIDVKQKQDQGSEIWGKLAGQYDIRNATFDELCEMSLKLYEAGQISLLEHGILTFDPSKSPITPGLNINLTPVNHEGRRDWIAEYEARLKRNSKINPSMCKVDQKLLQILKRLDR